MAASLSKHSLFLPCLAVVIAVALWFRMDGLTAKPFWLDEAYSAYAADKGFDFIFKVLPGYETHPPFYSAVLSAWTDILGNSILGFRSLGLFASIVTLFLFWFASNEIGHALKIDPRLCAIAGLALLAVSPPIVYVAQLVRPYALMASAYIFGIWCVFGLARSYRETGQLHRKFWLGYLVSLILTIWLHNLGILYAFVLGVALLTLIGPLLLIRDQTRIFFTGHLGVALFVLPAFLILLDQAPTWQKSTWLRFHWDRVAENLYTIYGLTGFGAFAIAAAIIISAVFKAGKTERPVWRALLILAFVPTLLSLLITVMIAPVFLPRTLAPLGTAFILLVSTAAIARALINRIAFAALLILTVIQMIGLHRQAPNENWYGAVAWLKPRVAPGDVIYAYPNEGALPLSYALRDKGINMLIRSVPAPVPANDPSGWHPTGSRGVVSLPQHRLEAIATDLPSRTARTIWLLRLGASTYDKENGFLKALSQTRRPVARWTEDPIDIIGLRQSGQIAPRKQAQP